LYRRLPTWIDPALINRPLALMRTSALAMGVRARFAQPVLSVPEVMLTVAAPNKPIDANVPLDQVPPLTRTFPVPPCATASPMVPLETRAEEKTFIVPVPAEPTMMLPLELRVALLLIVSVPCPPASAAI
jgi:hypothetical protein